MMCSAGVTKPAAFSVLAMRFFKLAETAAAGAAGQALRYDQLEIDVFGHALDQTMRLGQASAATKHQLNAAAVGAGDGVQHLGDQQVFFNHAFDQRSQPLTYRAGDPIMLLVCNRFHNAPC